MILTQKWLVADTSSSREVNVALCTAEGCCGFFSGIPPFLAEVALNEQWVLPHIWIETVIIPEPEGAQLTSALEQI